MHPALLLQPFTRQRGQTLLLPPLTVSISRRLFPNSPTQGSLEASLTPSGPTISVGVTSSAFHDTSLERAASDEPPNEELNLRAPSSSGLAVYSSDWQIGFDLAGVSTGVNARYGITLLELGVHLQTVVRLGLAGLTWLVGGEWRGSNGALGANVSVNADGVVLRVECVTTSLLGCREANGRTAPRTTAKRSVFRSSCRTSTTSRLDFGRRSYLLPHWHCSITWSCGRAVGARGFSRCRYPDVTYVCP